MSGPVPAPAEPPGQFNRTGASVRQQVFKVVEPTHTTEQQNQGFKGDVLPVFGVANGLQGHTNLRCQRLLRQVGAQARLTQPLTQQR